jgi:hypothetical protein
VLALRAPRVLAAVCLAVLGAAQQPQTFKIAGQVVHDRDNRAVRGARVSITMVEHPDRQLSVVSGANGEFQFFGLPPAKYQLRAEFRGSTQFYQQLEEYSTAIVVGPALDSEHIAFPLDSAASISGSVVDGDGDPVSGASVYLFGRSVSRGMFQTGLKGQANTNMTGTFHIGHLSPGTYYVAAAAHPWYAQNQIPTPPTDPNNSPNPQPEPHPELDVAFPLTYYAASTTPESATPLTLEEGSKAEIQFTLNAVPAVHVALDGIEKPPEQNIQASLSQVGPGGTLISVNGVLTPNGVAGVAPGNYLLSASLIEQNGQSALGSQAVTLTGDSTVHLNEVIRTSVTGKVLFDGHIPENLSVWLGDSSNGNTLWLPIAKDGSFNLSQTQPGRYSLLMGNTSEFYIRDISVKGAGFAGGVLEIAKGAQIELTITAAKGMTKIDGTVVNGKTPVAGALVLIIPQDANRAKYIPRDQSDSDGTFTLFQVPPGRYTLVAIQNGRDLAYAEPGVMAPYLPHGQVLDVPLPKNARVEVEVQARR